MKEESRRQLDWSRSKKLEFDGEQYVYNKYTVGRYKNNNYIKKIEQEGIIYFNKIDIIKYNQLSIDNVRKVPFTIEKNDKEYCNVKYAEKIGVNQYILQKIKDKIICGAFNMYSTDEITQLLQNKANDTKLENTTITKAIRKYIKYLGEEVIREAKGPASLKSIKISSLNYRLEYYADSYTVEIYKLGKLQRFYYLSEFLKFCEGIKWNT